VRADRELLAVLQRDVDAAKNAYESVERRFNHTSLESQATQTNVFLLRPAVEPLTPSSPKLVRDSLAALFVGLVLGLGAALAREMLDRRVRCVDDVTGLLEMPVLVVLARGAKRNAIGVEQQPARLALR
jgi:capsular polysaccharide biosynthesis protein